MTCVWLFPGQGAQQIGMGEALYQTWPEVRQVFEEATAYLKWDVAKLCFKGPRPQLNSTLYTQPAIYTLSYAVSKLLLGHGLSPDYCAGHSLGEFSALTAAGVLAFSDGIQLIAQRARLMEESFSLTKAGMAAVEQATPTQVQKWLESCADPVWVANDNAPNQIVISGTEQGLLQCLELAKNQGAKITRLNVSGAYHTPLLQDASEKFSELIDSLILMPPQFPVIGNVNAQALSDIVHIKEELKIHMTKSVQWQKTMGLLLSQVAPVNFIELGPSRVLKGLLLRNDRRANCRNTESVLEINSLLKT